MSLQPYSHEQLSQPSGSSQQQAGPVISAAPVHNGPVGGQVPGGVGPVGGQPPVKKMPRGYDHAIRKQIDMNVDQGEGNSYPKGRCIHCEKIIAVTASTIKRHLKGCQPYEKHRREHPELHPESTELTPRKSLNKSLAPGTATKRKASSLGPAGAALITASFAPSHELHAEAAQLQAARAIYVGGLPFRSYASQDMADLFRLLNPGFRCPTEEELSNELLDMVYQEYLQRVRAIIGSAPWLNIILDASDNARDEMALNVCVSPGPGTTYYWTRINTGPIEVTASDRLQMLLPVLNDITGENPNRIISYTMSTERVGGELNFMHCPVRNRLPQDKVEKLIFIYQNHRVLNMKSQTWTHLLEKEIEEMERLLFSDSTLQ